MAATSKAPWTVYVVALFVQGLPTTISMNVRQRIHRDIQTAEAGKDVTTWTDSDGTVYDIYKEQALSGAFGNDLSNAIAACAQRTSGKPLGVYTYENAPGSQLYNDCGGQVYMLQSASGMPGNTAAIGQIQDVFSSDALAGNYNSCNHPNGKKYIYQGVWVSSVPEGASVICAALAATASATGDPHLQNVHGERFDLMKPGKHVLINIPRGARDDTSLLRVEAEARRLGDNCADMYFQALNVTGRWAEAKHAGGYHYNVQSGAKDSPEWLTVGKVKVKVAYGRMQDGLVYLNFFVKDLGRAGFAVGGLLGEDDYHDVNTPPAGCARELALRAAAHASSPTAKSVAIASVA